ncbi:DUF887-domain-containing protein [Aaosphaeria arxii CBS 175.79]|uniref:DUF887-domain-containing protein n=1 Tax=Aaosphaeria arxii CBS 175.79 TaxID=1450172 RepID=A0A6A5Y8B5_9PLEO|nr:DUF887-domain-containing protein [Aaosphaeria arxii CBS 175.79]KAF2020991.1 DUF887-domain-containing protein [Aaosphaeria arxii CBS 175.79]
MLDPFPFPPPAGLVSYIEPIADKLALKTLPYHFHEVVFAFTLYHITNKYLSPAFSRFFFPRIYPTFNARTKLNWDVHIVSFVQSTLINILALWVIFTDDVRTEMSWQDRVFGYTGAGGLIQGFATGYFVWDLFITLQNVTVFGPGMLAHAVSALFVFSLGFVSKPYHYKCPRQECRPTRPFVNFYAPTFILYELSSPFLNIHWFCDKLNLTGSKIQLYNGIFLLVTFFSCRLVWGSYQSVRVFTDVYRAMTMEPGTLQNVKFNNETSADGSLIPDNDIMRFAGEGQVPFWLAGCYLASNLTLNGLNWFWFGKMIATIRKRFDPPLGTRKAEEAAAALPEEEKVLVEGIHVETPGVEELNGGDYLGSKQIDVQKGKKHLEVQANEVRSRSTRRKG